MDLAEKMAYDYFTSLGIKDIVHEPDGNVPPDLLFGNKIAVEVRRLNPQQPPYLFRTAAKSLRFKLSAWNPQMAVITNAQYPIG